MKIFKIEKFLSIIPYFSTYFIIFASMFMLKRFRATLRHWLFFYGICIVLLIGGGFVFHALFETHPFVVHVINIPFFAAVSFSLIYLQEKVYKVFQEKNSKP